MVGSHSIKRKKPQADKSTEKGIERLVRIVPDPNRYVIARIPLNVVDGVPTLQAPGAQLPLHTNGNALMEALHDDPHLKSGKDGVLGDVFTI